MHRPGHHPSPRDVPRPRRTQVVGAGLAGAKVVGAVLVGAGLVLAGLGIPLLAGFGPGAVVASASACEMAPDADCRAPRTAPAPEAPAPATPALALAACGPWSDPVEGGSGGRVDTWRIDDVPSGATFDLRLEGEGGLVRVIVAYPVGHDAFDAGWRRLSPHAGGAAEGAPDPLGVELHELFHKGAAAAVEVTVQTFTVPTRWSYWLRCRWP
jgi:hypothetical protein